MKTVALILLTSLLFMFVPKTSIVFGDNSDKYCAKLTDGKLVVVHNGTTINAEVKLSDGSKVYPDGSIIDKDGAKRFLQNGECIDKNGKMTYPKMEEAKSAQSK
ncbi:MAG TPA: DUF6799 domain-containing protein [Bacteroidia bacterium]